MSSIKTIQRVLVQFIDTAQHIEAVEVQTHVRSIGDMSNEGFEGDLVDIENRARMILREQGFDEPDFSMIGALTAICHGLSRGRIIWIKQAAMEETRARW